MQVITIVMIIGFAIIILGLILTEMHNHQIEVSNNRSLKRYRYQENIDIIPTYRKRYISTENYTGKFETLDDFAFVFKMDIHLTPGGVVASTDKVGAWQTMHGPQGEISRVNLQGPKITAEKEMMYTWFRHIKDALDTHLT